jgi:hypothetical protein
VAGTIRRGAIALLLLAALSSGAAAQGTLAEPPGSILYDDLAHFRALGLWRGSLEIRPMTLSAICSATTQIRDRASELAGADLARLARLERACAELPAASSPTRSAADRPSETPAGSLPDSRWELTAGLQFYGGPSNVDSLADLDRRPRGDGALTLTLSAEIARQLSAQLRFYEDYSRLTPQPRSNWVDNLPPDLAGITDDPSARNDRAVLAYNPGWIEVRFGREDRRWGTGQRGTLFLSENPFPLDGLSLRFATRYVSGVSLFAQTQRGPNPPDLIPGEPYPGEEHIPGEAFFAAHRFEITPPWPLSIGLYEAVAYGGRGIDLAYVNPVGFLVAITQDIWDRAHTDDKKVLGADLRVDLPPCTLYGEFLLDRLMVRGQAEEGDQSAISSFAQLLGLRWANPLGIRGADLDLEYAHLDPQVYFHKDRDVRYALITDDRLGEGKLIGHWLGPNADDLYAALRVPFMSGRIDLEFELARWGLIDGLRGVDLGFVGLTRREKAWITGEETIERLLAVSWEKRAWQTHLPGELDVRVTLAHLHRSAMGTRGGWQGELRIGWHMSKTLKDI